VKKIVTIGEILVEIMATTRGNGFREPLQLVGPFASGAPAIFIDQVARLGQPCAMIGCVGDDDFGRLNLDRLKCDGVDVSGIAIDPEAATGSAFVRYREDGARDFVFNIKHSASGRTVLTDTAKAVIANSDHLHVMGTALFAPPIIAAILAAVDAVKAKGGTVSFDPNVRQELLGLPGLREAFDRIFAQCDLFLPSGPELFLFTQAKTEEEAITDILRRGVRAVVVKHGAEGALYRDASTSLRQTAFHVEEIDPTGAGDCFGATFITCWLRGMSPEKSLAYAAASGARAVEKQGPMEGVSTFSQLDSFLSSRQAEILP
jgi:sugar/nucleoside kinase (ribokinase family)